MPSKKSAQNKTPMVYIYIYIYMEFYGNTARMEKFKGNKSSA